MIRQITCCKGCVPPARHPGCHDTCDKYISERVAYEDMLRIINEERDKYMSMERYVKEQKVKQIRRKKWER